MLDAPLTQALSRYLDLQTARMKLTATNMANQNTAGYARRTVSWTGGDTVTLSRLASPGAPTVSVTASRDTVLDATVSEATAGSSSAGTVKTALDTLQSVFAIDSSGDEGSGINAGLSGFFAAMQAVAADPASGSARQAAFAAAQTLAAVFQATGNKLQGQAEDLDGAIRNTVGSVNQLTASIASLNGSIAGAGTTAERDSLIDQRTAQIQALSQLVDVEQTANSDGLVSLTTSSGGALVVGSHSNAMTVSIVSGALQLYVLGNNITGGLEGGSIGGALDVRAGALADTQLRLDALAMGVANAVNAANANGTTATGDAGQPVFSISSSSPHPAATFTVVASNGADFAAAGSGEGANGTGNANAMAALGTQKDAFGNTFADMLSAAISSIGTAAASASTAASAAAARLTQATSNQGALSGVSFDTEASNLTQYQRSYQAEAKLLAVLNQIMADAINLGTNTAVS